MSLCLVVCIQIWPSGRHYERFWNALAGLKLLTESEVASSGTADSFLKVSHLTRIRHIHQITLLTLQKLQKEAFLQSRSNQSESTWRNDMQTKSPTFMYWDLILRYETLILIFIRVHREKNFRLYVAVLEKWIPPFFALDHVNYSRWMHVHIRKIEELARPYQR